MSNNDNGNGYISLHRKIEKNWTWFSEPFSRGQAWVDLILLANHKDGFYLKRSIRIEVKRGQVGWCLDSLAERWKWSRGKVERFIILLEKDNQVVRQKNNITTIISIVKYDSYQDSSKASNKANDKANDNANGHQTIKQVIKQTITQTDTNNNDNKYNNDNNDNKINISFDDFWNLYDKKVGDKQKLEFKWNGLSDDERQKAMLHIPKYKISQPDKKFRKDPSTYLNNKSFNDEIINSAFPKAEPFEIPNTKKEEPKEYWQIKYGHLAKTKEEFMKLVAEGKIED